MIQTMQTIAVKGVPPNALQSLIRGHGNVSEKTAEHEDGDIFTLATFFIVA